LPFFHLRASQKNKFRRRCSHFSFLIPPYLAFSNASTPIYRGSKAEFCEHLNNVILPPRCSQMPVLWLSLAFKPSFKSVVNSMKMYNRYIVWRICMSTYIQHGYRIASAFFGLSVL